MWDLRQASTAYQNEASAYYNRLISEMYDSSWYGSLTDDEVRYYVSLMHGTRSLEFPVGTGRLAIALLKAGVDLFGFDNSPEMLGSLRKKLAAQSMSGDTERFIHWGALNTPYPCPPKSFGVAAIAFASFSLMHSNTGRRIDDNCVLRELNRVLHDGGLVVINDYRTKKIDHDGLKNGHVFDHRHRHPTHGEILEEQISDYKVEPNALIPNQVIRYRQNRLVRLSDGAVLSASSEVTPIWDVETFPMLGEDAGFEYVHGEVVHFHVDQTINHVFRKRHDL